MSHHILNYQISPIAYCLFPIAYLRFFRFFLRDSCACFRFAFVF